MCLWDIELLIQTGHCESSQQFLPPSLGNTGNLEAGRVNLTELGTENRSQVHHVSAWLPFSSMSCNRNRLLRGGGRPPASCVHARKHPLCAVPLLSGRTLLSPPVPVFNEG